MSSRLLQLFVGLAVFSMTGCDRLGSSTSPPADSSVSRAEFVKLSENVARLSEGVTRLADTKLAAANTNNADPLDEGIRLASAVTGADITGDNPPSAPTTLTTEERMRDLETKLDVITEVQRNHETQLGQIAQQDQNDGSYYLRLNAKNPAARNEVRQAIQDAAPETGRLIVTNRMGTDQFVFVEGDGYLVRANEARQIPVRRGTVSTNLPGQERVMWTIAAPDYEQFVDIRPRQVGPLPGQSAPPMSTVMYVDPVTGVGYVAGR